MGPRKTPLKTSLKPKSFFQNLHFPHQMYGKAKPLLLKLIASFHLPIFRKTKAKDLVLGSFRLHYNWCSSNVPSSCSVTLTTPSEYGDISGYLEWLEEHKDRETRNDIDRLADMFIANCHHKFMLEKQESNRRFQAMMARSI